MNTTSIPRGCALILAALPLMAQAAQLDVATSASLLTTTSRTVTDATVDGVAATVSRTTALSLAQFDVATGVLVGASASLTAGTAVRNLAVTGSEGSASVDSVFTLGSNSVSGTLNQTSLSASPDASWGSLSIASLSSLAGYVGTGTVAGSVVTTLSAQRTDAAGTGTTATITTSAGATSVLNNYTATVSYNYLQHANGSWAADADSDHQAFLNLGTAGRSFSLFALAGSLGAAETTALDLLSINCTGQCQAFQLSFNTFQDLAAGGQLSGSVAAVQGLAAGTYLSSYTFSLADDSAVGEAGSQAANTMTMSVRTVVSAVPDAPALVLMGVGGLVLVGRGRRATAATG